MTGTAQATAEMFMQPAAEGYRRDAIYPRHHSMIGQQICMPGSNRFMLLMDGDIY